MPDLTYTIPATKHVRVGRAAGRTRRLAAARNARPARWPVIALAAVFCGTGPASGFQANPPDEEAQRIQILQQQQQIVLQRINQLTQRGRGGAISPDDLRLQPVSDADAERWLKRAQEAADRGDWKLAADSLRRVIDQYGDRTVSADDGAAFYSAADVAVRQLRAWPPEGLATYRLLYDAEVRRLLDDARAKHDLDLLRSIVRRYPLATPAPEAMDLLAAWLLDGREAGEAVDVLRDLLESPQDDIPRWQTLSKLAVAYALAGQWDDARAALNELAAMENDGASNVPGDLSSRIASIRAFLDDRSGAVPVDAAAGVALPGEAAVWPAMLGPPRRSGVMAALDPVITPDDAWRQPLPGVEGLDLRTVHRLQRKTGRPPTWQCVSDAARLFVSCPEGVIALDMATLDLLWRSVPRSRPPDEQVARFRQIVGTYESGDSDSANLDALTTAALFHEYRGAITTAFNQVYVIEQFGTAGEVFPSLDGTAPPNETAGGNAEPNSIRAFEADTGRALWTKGRGGPLADEWRLAHFFCPPVAAGPVLIAPYQVADDLYLAVLKPDGAIERKVFLGSSRAAAFPMNGVLQPTVHEGVIYCPTGAGVLIALDAFDYSLKWMASYDRWNAIQESKPTVRFHFGARSLRIAQPDGWLSSPPVVCGGQVLTAPPDCEHLLAFDRRDGALRWSFPRGRNRYVFGADGRRVYLAGESVQAVRLADGEAAWQFDGDVVSGRPAVCGNEILVPTFGGLVRLNAENGAPLGEPRAADQPLGNLLALDGALYSVTAEAVSKFPDPDQSRRLAEERLAQNPDDVDAVLRLAWLASLERQWRPALDLLDRAERILVKRLRRRPLGGADGSTDTADDSGAAGASNEPDAGVERRIAHQRVLVLLNLAAESPAGERAPLLEQAAEAARRPDDAIKTGLAISELEAEQGNHAAAFERCLDLLVSQGSVPVRLEPQLDARAAVLIRERLEGFWRDATPAQRDAIIQRVERLVANDEAQPPHQTAAVQRVAMADVLDLSGAEADPRLIEFAAALDLRLGRRAMADAAYETGVFFLERAARRAVDTPTGREALARLADYYSSSFSSDSSAPVAPYDAARVLDLLARLHGDASIVLEGGQGTGDSPASTSVARFVDKRRRRLPDGLSASHPMLPRLLTENPSLQMVGGSWAPATVPRDVVSFYDPNEPERSQQVLPIRFLRQLVGLNLHRLREEAPGAGRTRRLAAATGDNEREILWATNVDYGPAEARELIQGGFFLDLQDAAVADRLVVLACGSQIHALGMDTGRMIWPSLVIEDDPAMLPKPQVLAIDGMVIIAGDASSLTALPARDGARPVWRRHFPGRRLGALAKSDGQLIVMDASGETVMVIDPRSGRIRRQFGILVPTRPATEGVGLEMAIQRIVEETQGRLAAPTQVADAPAADVHVAFVGNLVCRAGQTSVVGRDLRTGLIAWELPLAGMIRGLVRLDDGHLGVSYRRKHFAVVSARNGAILRDVTLNDLELPPIDATLDGAAGGRLLLFAQTRDDPPHHALASFPLDESQAGWQRDLGRIGSVSPRMLRASPDYVAAVAYRIRDERARQRQIWGGRSTGNLASAKLLILDKATGGRLIRRPYAFDLARQSDNPFFTGFISDVVVLEDRIVAVGPDGYYVLAAGSTGDEADERVGLLDSQP